MSKKTKEEILEEYKKKADEIIKKMYLVVARTQRKQDDSVYKEMLNKL